MAVDEVVEALKQMSRPVTTPEEISQVGHTILWCSVCIELIHGTLTFSVMSTFSAIVNT